MAKDLQSDIDDLKASNAQLVTASNDAADRLRTISADLAKALAAAGAAGATPDQLGDLETLNTSMMSEASALEAAVQAAPDPNAPPETTTAGGGDDAISGGNGDDTLSGGAAGDDTVSGT